MTSLSTVENAQFQTSGLQQIQRELEIRLRQQAGLTTLSQSALKCFELQELFAVTVDLVAKILEAEMCKVLQMLPGEESLLLIAGVGWKEGLVGTAEVGTGEDTQAGYTLLAGQPVIVEDLKHETRFRGTALLHDHNVRSGMSVIIYGKGGSPFGVLGVHDRRARAFSIHDTQFIQGAANILSSAIQRIQTEQELRLSRDRLNAIFQNVDEGITVQDCTGKLVFANEAAAIQMGMETSEKALAMPAGEIVSRFELYTEAGEPFPLEKLPGRMALSAGISSSALIRFCHRQTQIDRWTLIRAAPIHDAQGKIEFAVTSFKDVTDIKRMEGAQSMLAQASHILSSSLGYQDTLRSVAQLAIQHFADWCTIHLLEEDQELLQLVVAHKDPEKVNLALETQKRYPPNPENPGGVYQVLRTGEPEYFPAISPDMLARSAQDEEHLRRLGELGLNAALILPLTARDRTLGALSLLWAESGRTYTNNDLHLAEELARRAAIAIDNARLYRTAQKLNETLEAQVQERTQQLQAVINQLRGEINERQKAEEALRYSEVFLNSLFESSPDATLIIRQDGGIVRSNQQAEHTFGYTKKELLNQPVEVLLPKRFHALHSQHRQNYLDDFRLRPMGANQELYACRKDGSEFPVDIMLSPVQIGEETLIIASLRDITERKAMQTELAELNRRLIDSLEAERLHLAQELHDGPMQDLYGISFKLKNLELNLGDANPSLYEDVRQTNRLAQEVVGQLRSVCGELRPPSLAPFGLEKAIRAHMEALYLNHPKLEINLDLQPDRQLLPEHVRLALFRIFQHAISNVIRHAEATQVRISLSYDDQELLLRIEDNGRGFKMPRRWIELARKGHLGLVGTAERAEAIGGQLYIDAQTGRGTLIQVKVPIRNDSEKTS